MIPGCAHIVESQKLQGDLPLSGKARSLAQIVFIVVKTWNDRQTDDQMPVRQRGQIPDYSLVGDYENLSVAGVIHMFQVNQELVDHQGQPTAQRIGKKSVGFQRGMNAFPVQNLCLGEEI